MSSRKPGTRHRGVHEQNRVSWNAATAPHNSHKVDQKGFFRNGGSTLFPDEIELLGEIDGARLVHLQCNCGQDSLSLSRRGAGVTGVDISDEAIAFAQTLAEQTQIPATFHRSDLFDWFDATDETFDVAYSTYGTIGWLQDLDRWARGVHRVLIPGGRLVLLEFHPLIWSFGGDGRITEPYFIDEPIAEPGVSDYVGEGLAPSGFDKAREDFDNPECCTCYQHTTADIVTAVVGAGLRIDRLVEYPYANGCKVFEGMEPLPNRRYGMPAGTPAMPMMLGLCAHRAPE